MGLAQAHTSSTPIKDIEEFLAYKKDSYNEFDLHLKVIRENMLGNSAVKQVIKNASNRNKARRM